MNKNLFLKYLAAAVLATACINSTRAANSVSTVVPQGLFQPYDVAVADDGTAYVSDAGNHRIVKVPSGFTTFSVLAGGIAGFNNGSGNAARFNVPQGIVIARGGLVVADSANHVLRFVTFSGIVTNLAGVAGTFGLVDGPAASAQFRFPAGLAVDSAGNIYVADAFNRAVRKIDTNNIVTTIATNIFQVSGIAVAPNGDLWVTETSRHCVKRIEPNGTVTLMAGTFNVAGSSDNTEATAARFSSPRGIVSVGNGRDFLVTDSGNHTVRRIYFNQDFNAWAVETFAGVPGELGANDGAALSAKFNVPVGITRDPYNGGFMVVDKANNVLRRIDTGPIQPPVANPVVGWVDLVQDPNGAPGQLITLLRPVVSAVFNNEVVVAMLTEAGTQNYFTHGPTPPNPFEDTIPEPAPGAGANPPPYRDGLPASQMPPSMVQVQPDMTIKAIGMSEGRRSSQLVTSRFIFKTANVNIVGDNAASFRLENITRDAEMWYTWDGSEPSNDPQVNPNSFGPRVAGDTISFNLENSNRTFRVRAYRRNFRPSDVITKVFSPSNFVANTISFGFEAGEASSEFVAAAGQRFYAPVTLSLLPGQKIYSFQFNVVVTNVNGIPVNGLSPMFGSMLMKPMPGQEGKFVTIPPQMFVGMDTNIMEPVFSDLIFRNPAANLLGVGWLERRGEEYLFKTKEQDLVTYSMAHDTIFNSASGKAILGAYSFVVPAGATDGSTYQIQIGRPSATADGISQDIFINSPTNGSLGAGRLNGTKVVTVASRSYLVGDVAPFRWFNAGDFGDTNLLNNDVLQVFQSAVYLLNRPPENSDMFDSMDSSDGFRNELFEGSDTSIDNIRYGDGELNVDDIFVTFRRSLDPSRKWFARYWSNGVRVAVEVPNRAPKNLTTPQPKSLPKIVRTGTPTVVITPDDIIGEPGSTVQVPVRVRISGGLPVRVAMLGIEVQPLDGSPALTQQIGLTPAAGLGTPGMSTTPGLNRITAAWLNATATGVSGDTVLATLSVTIPTNATPNAAYRVKIEHFSASENGLALFRQHAYDGLVTLQSREASSWSDGISDAWRLRYFGSVHNLRSVATADPDQDGVNNLGEFRAGTHPLNASSLLRLGSVPGGPATVRLNYPTSAGRNYVIECAPEIIGPWTPIYTNSGDGSVREFSHTAPGSGRAFYRVRAQ